MFGRLITQILPLKGFASTDVKAYLTASEVKRMARYSDSWQFYNGEHFANIPQEDRPEVVHNWSRRIVNLFTAIETLGISFRFSNQQAEEVALPFLNDVWERSGRDSLLFNAFQEKDVCGDTYFLVNYIPKLLMNGSPNPDFNDPFGEIEEDGTISIFRVPSSICFPKWKDGYVDEMESCTILFPIDTESFGIRRVKIIRYVYFPDKIECYENDTMAEGYPIENPFKFIPVVHLKNIRSGVDPYGISDIEDIIPINTELNLKNSDVSEILDYHTSPVTVIFGARAQQLDKGANKVWSGLPEKGRVEQLSLNSDLGFSTEYRKDQKKAIHSIGAAPAIATGDMDLPANISGPALHTAFLPTTLQLSLKRKHSSPALVKLNKMILSIAVNKKLLAVPQGMKTKDLLAHKVIYADYLPKDQLQELQALQQEFKLGLESRKGALERLGRDNIEEKIKEVDNEWKDDPISYGVNPTILSQGQKLINPDTGKVIADNPAPAMPTPQEIGGSGNTNSTTVGKNKEGKDAKVNSGFMNSNPGKK